MSKQPSVFPKLFIGDAYYAFKKYLAKHNLPYEINYLNSSDELHDFIELYSNYKNYNLPVIIADVSFFNKKDQSCLLKFMDDTNLKIILLASRDNILDTIISRTKEFRKYYIKTDNDTVNYFEINKARDMLNTELSNLDKVSYEDRLLICNKYNPVIAYNDSLVKRFKTNDKLKLLSIIEY